MHTRTLLLNASYEAIAVISVKRAIILLLQEKAEAISVDEENPVRTPSTTFPRPTVVRLITYRTIPAYRKLTLTSRTILVRDDFVCAYCGGRATTMDHIFPKAKGGRHKWSNVIACCFPCNQEKGDRTLEEMGWTPRFKPTEPEGVRRSLISHGASHPDWDEWLAHLKV